MSDPVDGVLEEDEANYDWTEFFRRDGIYYDAMRFAVGKAIAWGIYHGAVTVDYVDSAFQVRLTRAWIEQNLGSKLPL